MPEIKSARQISEERAALQGSVKNSFKDAGIGAVRPLDMNNISEGEVVTIPVDYKIYEMPIAGSTNKAVKIVTVEGKDLWVGCLTRGAMPAEEGSTYVKPSGTVVEAVQKYGSLDDAFKDELAGKKIKFTKKTPVVTVDRWSANGGTRTTNVWTIDFVA